ncbi:hypothetical protein [Paenibacillus turpanensis]|uniref:hypothetical protein n=1 Tax=Paenibacillus turpanensis TaxID=2689078 RepID=UPI001409AAF9|nr:hypothetical protein [Paenibacillus turpanensis]
MRTNNLGLITSSIIVGACMIISSYISINATDKVTLDTTQEFSSHNGVFMTMEQTADFLQLSEEDIVNIISSEEKTLREVGHFNGTMFPYIKIRNVFYFNKTALQEWVLEVSKTKRTYDQGKVIN